MSTHSLPFRDQGFVQDRGSSNNCLFKIIVIPDPFPHVPMHVCFMMEIVMVLILLQNANPAIVGTRSVTRNSKKRTPF